LDQNSTKKEWQLEEEADEGREEEDTITAEMPNQAYQYIHYSSL
jgi:hypothetical protein